MLDKTDENPSVPKIETVGSVAREALTKLGAAAVERFADAVFPIFAWDGKNPPRPLGTCILLGLGGRFYLLTAAHVIDEADSADLHIAVKPPIPVSLTFRSSPPVDDDRDKDIYDFAIAELSDSMVQELGPRHFIGLDEIAVDRDFKRGRCYAAYGYPHSRNKKVDNVKKLIKTSGFPYSGVAKDPGRAALKKGMGHSTHIFIGHDKRSLDETGQKTPSIGIPGMSGGAFFDIGDLTDPEVLAGTSMPRPKLAGLLIERVKEDKLVVATRIDTILRLAGLLS